jgi:hypothetical protein
LQSLQQICNKHYTISYSISKTMEPLYHFKQHNQNMEPLYNLKQHNQTMESLYNFKQHNWNTKLYPQEQC